MTTVIELTENQSAAPRCCGSCHFFDRGGRTDWVGNCRVSLPPHYWLLLPGARNEQGPDTGLADNRSCDLSLCGRNASEWLTIGGFTSQQADSFHLCDRCRAALLKAI